MTAWRIGAVLVAAAVVAACSKEAQPQSPSVRKADTPSHQGAQAPFVTAGWQPGDPQSWEEQMRRRVQNQNEYVRIK